MKQWPKPEIVLIGRDGKEKARLPVRTDRELIHDRMLWRFGVAKVNGEQFFYEMEAGQ